MKKAERARTVDPLVKVRRWLPFDETRHPVDPEIASLVSALNATGWIVTVGSCSGLHEDAPNRGVGYVHVGVRASDVLRFASLLNRLQLAEGESAAWVLNCSLVFEESIVCSCDPVEFPDVVFFSVLMALAGQSEAEGTRQLESMAVLIAELG